MKRVLAAALVIILVFSLGCTQAPADTQGNGAHDSGIGGEAATGGITEPLVFPPDVEDTNEPPELPPLDGGAE